MGNVTDLHTIKALRNVSVDNEIFLRPREPADGTRILEILVSDEFLTLSGYNNSHE